MGMHDPDSTPFGRSWDDMRPMRYTGSWNDRTLPLPYSLFSPFSSLLPTHGRPAMQSCHGGPFGALVGRTAKMWAGTGEREGLTGLRVVRYWPAASEGHVVAR
jgi:hypothetical protein